MANAYCMQTLVAGRYVKVVRTSRPLPRDTESTRAAKRTATEAAQKFINIKNATERLQLLMCANFDSKEACFCTFTFIDEALPANQKHTQRIFADYLKSLRQEWRRKGRDLKYIYTVEGAALDVAPSTGAVVSDTWEIVPWKDSVRWGKLDSQEGQEAREEAVRLHIHGFFLLRKEDYEAIRALWPYGHVYINSMKINEPTTFPRLASYVTKEKRTDVKGNGIRSYIPSRNLLQPIKESHWCEEYEGLVPPKGAEVIKSGAERNELYSASMEYLFYRLPREQQQIQPYKGKGKLNRKKKRT